MLYHPVLLLSFFLLPTIMMASAAVQRPQLPKTYRRQTLELKAAVINRNMEDRKREKEAKKKLHHLHQRGRPKAKAVKMVAKIPAEDDEEDDDDDDGERYEDTWMQRRSLARDPTMSNWEEFSAGYRVLLLICGLLMLIMLLSSFTWIRKEGARSDASEPSLVSKEKSNLSNSGNSFRSISTSSSALQLSDH